jgi:hypothetical protein
MSQNDFTIANQGFPAFRSDLNSALQALASTNSGSSAPPTTFANQFFYDTTNNVLKFRNEDNDAFITLCTLNQATDAVTSFAGLVIGTDVQAYDADNAVLDTNQTFTGDITFSGTSKVQQTKEKMTISATASTGTINYDALTQAVLYYTTDASGNWTLNVRADASTTLNSIMSIGESLTVVFLSTQGATAYYNSAFQVDGSSITPKWQGGSAPSAGNVSGIDTYIYTIIKTADATFTALGSIVDFS